MRRSGKNSAEARGLGRQLPGSGTAAASRAAYNRMPSFGEAPRARSEARDVQPDPVLWRPRTVCAVGRSTQSPGRIAPLFFCSPAASSLPWLCVRRADCLTDTANFAFMPMEHRSLLSSTVNSPAATAEIAAPRLQGFFSLAAGKTPEASRCSSRSRP